MHLADDIQKERTRLCYFCIWRAPIWTLNSTDQFQCIASHLQAEFLSTKTKRSDHAYQIIIFYSRHINY